MAKQRTVTAVITIIGIVATWTLWTMGVPLLERIVSIRLCYPFSVADGEPVGYHFFILRRLLLFATIFGTVACAWLCARTPWQEKGLRKWIGQLGILLAAMQLFGFVLFALYPESYLHNLRVYGYFADNQHPPGFTVHRFFSIRSCMTHYEVAQLLGRGRQATTIPGWEDHCWMYGADWSDTGWYFMVYFHAEGSVERKEAYFCWD